MKEDRWTLKKLHIGLRHQRTFMVSDIHGLMIDAVLALQGKGIFPSDAFTQIARPDVLSVLLTGETLTLNLNVDGVILSAAVDEEHPATLESLERMFATVVRGIATLTNAGDKINRIGIVHEFELSGFENSAKAIFAEHLKIDLKGIPDSIFIRLALKNPSSSALIDPAKKGDYVTVFLTISSEREQEELEHIGAEEEEKVEKLPTLLKLTVDHQLCYVPPVSWKKARLDAHIATSEKYIDQLKESRININEMK
jgi:hypothetical protein